MGVASLTAMQLQIMVMVEGYICLESQSQQFDRAHSIAAMHPDMEEVFAGLLPRVSK